MIADILLPIIIALSFVYILMNLVTWFTMTSKYKSINEQELLREINKELPNGVNVNPYNKNIIRIGNKKNFICTLTFPGLLWKYYVNNEGVIPIWSESHKEIEKIYKKIKEEKDV